MLDALKDALAELADEHPSITNYHRIEAQKYYDKEKAFFKKRYATPLALD